MTEACAACGGPAFELVFSVLDAGTVSGVRVRVGEPWHIVESSACYSGCLALVQSATLKVATIDRGAPARNILFERFDPAFLVTESLMKRLQAGRLTGMEAAEVEVSTSNQFPNCRANTKLPRFAGLKVVGVAGQDDFGIGRCGRRPEASHPLEIAHETEVAGDLAASFRSGRRL